MPRRRAKKVRRRAPFASPGNKGDPRALSATHRRNAEDAEEKFNNRTDERAPSRSKCINESLFKRTNLRELCVSMVNGYS